MPEPVEKRAFPRTKIILPFIYKTKPPAADKSGTGSTHNLGEEGACVKLPERLDEGAGIRLLFQSSRGPIEFDAVVIWRSMIRQRGQGILHGVEFPELSPDQQQAIRELQRSEGLEKAGDLQ